MRREGHQALRGDGAQRLWLGAAIGLAVLAAFTSFPLVRWNHRVAQAPSAELGMTVEFDAHPAAGPPVLLVTSLRSDGAARRAGLEVGDRIERIDDIAPTSVRQAEHALRQARRLHLLVARHAREIVLALPVG